MRTIVIFLIGLYQRLISPYKGFRCAHAVYHHGPSCSAAVQGIVREHGVFAGLPLVRLRFAQCREAFLQLDIEDANEREQKRRRRDSEERSCCAGADDWDALDCGDAPGDCSFGDHH